MSERKPPRLTQFRPHEFLVVAFLLMLAVGLRFVGLGNHPTFISDEASIGYNAYSILKTGRDEWGARLPLAFKAFGEYKLPGYIYATVLPMAFFGLSEFSTRFMSALGGVVGAYFFYLLARRYAQELKMPAFGYLALFFYVANPWLIQVSRLALEANLALAFFLAGVWFLGRDRPILSGVLVGLTLYTYNAFRVFVPLWLVGSFLLGKIKWRQLRVVVLVLAVLSVPLFVTGFRGTRERLGAVALWQDPGLVARIGEKRVACQANLPAGICRRAYNRPVGYTAAFVANYLSHFSPQFLFLQGPGLAQYTMPGFGVAYLFEWVFLAVGAVYFFRSPRRWPGLVVWLLAAPIANSVTGAAHPVRSLMLAPMIPFLSALGAAYLYAHRPYFRRELLLVSVFSVAVSLGYFANRYFSVYPLATGSIWQQGYRPLFQYLEKIETRYDQIQVSKFYGEPHIFYLFYRQVDPASYQAGRGVERADRPDGWTNVDRIGKYLFFEDEPNRQEGLVVWASPQNATRAGGKVIYYRNGVPAFVIQEQF